ncbi:MAG: CoA transferase [Chloroflexi bacterium]|nr:CoA transferase [Chloroflexota bacterium]
MRVLDLGMVWAGAMASKFLADLGAEVVKVEGGSHPDSTRGSWPPTARIVYADDDPGTDPWNRTSLYLERNRNKLSLVVDLRDQRGVQVVKALAKVCDVVVENFRAGVVDRLGIGYDSLRQMRPDIIMISMSSQGMTGPEKSYGSFGNNLEQSGGLASFTGYRGGDPLSLGVQFPDPLAGGIAPGLVMAALRYRRHTGKGLYIDLSQRELTTYSIGEAFMDYSMNRRIWEPMGNRDRYAAPQGCYRCRGDDRWLAITVQTDEQWAALCRVIGRLELAADPRYASAEGRQAHHDELDRLIGDWAATQDAHHAMQVLQQEGVPAGAALDGKNVLEDPHLVARDFWERVQQRSGGVRRHMRPPFLLSRTPAVTRSPAPRFGEHNRLILGELLGLPEAEVKSLEAEGVVEDVPRWAAEVPGLDYRPRQAPAQSPDVL